MGIRHDVADSIFHKIDNMVNNMPQGYSPGVAADLEHLAAAYAHIAEWSPALGYKSDRRLDDDEESEGPFVV